MAVSAPQSTSSAPSAGVALEQVNKTFGDFTAVSDLNLEVKAGEFLAMLGPSGSGKTTVLRMIAGFEEVSSGTIRLDGRDVTRTPPFDRQVNTVFQDYALFPHMTIAANVGYGLKVRGMNKTDLQQRVQRALEQVQLATVADRFPHQLSGGQRQRIALARALILQPRVLLLDEPLGALDKQLREQMQVELKQIQREVGITFIFVTHDQEEALTLSDRIAVFNNGRVEQVGTAHEVYEYPETEFVAGFLGTTNLIPRHLSAQLAGIDGLISIRPERVRVHSADEPLADGDIGLTGEIVETVYTGSTTRFIIDTNAGQRMIADRHNAHHPTARAEFQRGDQVSVAWSDGHASVVP